MAKSIFIFGVEKYSKVCYNEIRKAVVYMENTNPKSRFNYKKLIVVCSIVLAVAIVISSVIFV